MKEVGMTTGMEMGNPFVTTNIALKFDRELSKEEVEKFEAFLKKAMTKATNPTKVEVVGVHDETPDSPVCAYFYTG